MIINMVPQRRVRDNIISSNAMPAIHIKVYPPLKFLWVQKFVVMESHHVEMYLFAETEGDNIKRLLTVQFEGYLPDNDFTYDYDVTRKVRLGAHDYLHDTGVLKLDAVLKRRPEGDIAAWVTWLRSQDYDYDKWNELIYSRFVRVIDVGKRNEILFLYFENLKDLGYGVDDLVSGGKHSGMLAGLSVQVDQRALDSFSVIKG